MKKEKTNTKVVPGGPWFKKGPGRDPEVLNRPIPEPPTELELMSHGKISDIDLDIFSHKLDSIVDEGRAVFEGLAMCETLQIGDDGTAIFTAMGDMASCSTGIYFHSLCNYGAAKYILKYYKDDATVGLKDGDIFFFNETLSGGVHPFDMFILMPVFVKEGLIAWVAAGGHQGESGSKDPGGFTPTGLTRYEEGLHVPPLKIGENFLVKTDHLDFLCNSVRNPRQLALDTKTRVAVCLRMRERLLREVEKRGADFVAAGMRGILERGAKAARDRLRSFNDGIYRAIIFLDTLGTEDGLLRLPVKLTKEDDHLTIDYTGASPEHRKGPYHLYWHFLRACTAVYLFSYVFRGLPLSIGLYEPIEVIAPAGTFLNASEEVAHGASSFSGRVCVQVLHMAGSKMIFDSPVKEVSSAPFSCNLMVYIFGGKDQYGNPVAGIPASINAAGQGARNDMDGEHTMGFFWSPVVDCLSAEECEAKFPWLYLSRNIFDKNQHGYGKYRGGVGMCDVFFFHNVPTFMLGAIGHGDHFSMNLGLFGGYAAPANPRLEIKNSNIREMMARTDEALPYGLYELANKQDIKGEYIWDRTNISAVPHYDKDIAVVLNGSGGGYGDALERDPNLVMKDLKEGLISDRVAREIYFVAYDPDTFEVDIERTEILRKNEREWRKKRGLKYEEFLKIWSKKKPKDEILKNFGPWSSGEDNSA